MSPFLHYRTRLESYRLALERGWSDDRFVALVQELDDSLARVHGHGFQITPFDSQASLAAAVGLAGDRLWVKDDTGNVAGSHKARHLFGVLLHQAISGQICGELAIASCGNAALAAAVVARAAGRPLTVYIPVWADEEVVAGLEALGANIEVCERRAGEHGDPTYLRFTEAVAKGAVPFSCQGTMTPTTLDGGRTLGWELADQMAERGIQGTVRLYVQVGGGALASAVWMGLCEAIRNGALPISPVMHPVQTVACAPLVRAWMRLEQESHDSLQRMARARGTPGDFMWPWENVGSSAASGILDDVTYDWLHIAQALCDSGGWPVTATEAEVLEAHRLVHAHTGIDADATGTAGLSGVLHDQHDGRLDGNDHVVTLFTGVTRRAV